MYMYIPRTYFMFWQFSSTNTYIHYLPRWKYTPQLNLNQHILSPTNSSWLTFSMFLLNVWLWSVMACQPPTSLRDNWLQLHSHCWLHHTLSFWHLQHTSPLQWDNDTGGAKLAVSCCFSTGFVQHPGAFALLYGNTPFEITGDSCIFKTVSEWRDMRFSRSLINLSRCTISFSGE